MDTQLTGARAFISGSTRGIGLAIARGLLSEGAEVIVNGRGEQRVASVVGDLRAEFPTARVSGIAADFRDPADVARLVGELSDLGGLDILVNNVGLFGVAAFTEISDTEWNDYFEVNVMSGVRLSRAVLPAMLARGRGRILFISSESGVSVPGDMVHYGATKAAMIAVANGLSKLTRGTGVTVNTILGGPTYSDGVADAVSGIAAAQGVDEAVLKASIAEDHPTSLLRRFLEPAEIAHLAVYLASPLASATNGAAVRADGGVLTTLV
ncbi:SDR family oxidoreductase [Herbiconiux sp. KACC 21604]|uniref:SDR family NAD(P)-dependent oxidoreductase n=1 Tax=unclassified Herbiconiux TaxID=2618217 RepID=UPI001490DA5F|nr:SDR family oxidoreductase [Herbiconiux sp. SALV-R1]QJU55598.1 SDR family oxidoreductase [Herbiconiux sp. SALV-R1]WPO86794.1 SDR family oxidoreductase [Herbiconiux sp. KACC 21604]